MVTERVARVRRWLALTLERLHRLAESGWGGTSAFLWGLGQSSVVPGPSEAVLIPLGVADPPKVWRLAAWTFAGTLVGGLAAFTIGALAFDVVRPMLGYLGIGDVELERMRALAGSHGALLVLVSAMTPISTKVVSIAAGAFGLPVEAFVATLALARGTRLFAVAAILRFAGGRLRSYLERRPFEAGDAAGRRPDDLARGFAADFARGAAERERPGEAGLRGEPRFDPVDPRADAGLAAERSVVAGERVAVAGERLVAAEEPRGPDRGAEGAAR